MFETILDLLLSFADVPTSRDVDEVVDGVDKNGKRIGSVRRIGKTIYMVLGILGFIALLIGIVVVLFIL